MIGCYDFPGHYEWTFAWLEGAGGEPLLRAYWSEAIARDSQRHAADAIRARGFDGMEAYWGHTLIEESPDLGFRIARGPDFFRFDIHDCPSKGFLLRNGLEQHRDYCDHCIGWIGPLMREAGFVIDHEHNHRGQCWWRIRSSDAAAVPVDASETEFDVRTLAGWKPPGTTVDRFVRANGPEDKQRG